jgi:predicted DNA-binding transcriptional regulator AlpA
MAGSDLLEAVDRTADLAELRRGSTRLLLRIEEVAPLIGFGRTNTFQMVAENIIPSIVVAGCRRVPAAALVRWIENLAAEQVAAR